MATPAYRIKQFAAPGGVWTDIAAPVPCNIWSVTSAGSSDFQVRSDVSDAASQQLLRGGGQQSLTVGRPQNQLAYRYNVGDVVCSVMPAAPDTIVGVFVL